MTTIKEIVTMFKEEKPNKVSDAHIIQWFNEAEAEVQDMLGIPYDDWETYTVEDIAEDAVTEPIAKPPYISLYLFYLMARLDYANQEFESYSNNQAQYVEAFENYKKFAYRNGLVVTELPRRFVNVI